MAVLQIASIKYSLFALASRCISLHAFILRFTSVRRVPGTTHRSVTNGEIVPVICSIYSVRLVRKLQPGSVASVNRILRRSGRAGCSGCAALTRQRLDYRQNGRSLYRHRANDDDCSDKVHLAGQFLDPLLRRRWLHLRQISGGTNTVGVPNLHVALYIAYLYPIPAVHIVVFCGWSLVILWLRVYKFDLKSTIWYCRF